MPVLSSLSRHEVSDLAQVAVGPRRCPPRAKATGPNPVGPAGARPAIPAKCGIPAERQGRASRVRPGYLPAARMVVASAALGRLTSTLVFGQNAHPCPVIRHGPKRALKTRRAHLAKADASGGRVKSRCPSILIRIVMLWATRGGTARNAAGIVSSSRCRSATSSTKL
jgi:hypothetical protein